MGLQNKKTGWIAFALSLVALCHHDLAAPGPFPKNGLKRIQDRLMGGPPRVDDTEILRGLCAGSDGRPSTGHPAL